MPPRNGILVRQCALMVLAVLLIVVPAVSGQGSRPSESHPRSDMFDAAQLLSDLETLSADAMQGRQTGTPGAEQARAFLTRRFREAGLAPVGGAFEHPFEPDRARGLVGGVNVVGLVPGSGAANRYIVVSAHYDHIGTSDGQVFNGANDNASGAAALMALASYFVAHRPTTSMLFVAFDAEERNLAGARAFVRRPPVPAEAIVANVNLDMLARDASETLWIAGTRLFPVFAPIATRAAAPAPIRVQLGHDGQPGSVAEDWTRDSDHFAFIEAGIPALYVGVEDSRYHHRADDDFSTIQAAFYVSAVEVIAHLLGDIDVDINAIARSRGTSR